MTSYGMYNDDVGGMSMKIQFVPGCGWVWLGVLIEIDRRAMCRGTGSSQQSQENQTSKTSGFNEHNKMENGDIGEVFGILYRVRNTSTLY